jgi:hypothetical protein
MLRKGKKDKILDTKRRNAMNRRFMKEVSERENLVEKMIVGSDLKRQSDLVVHALAN